MDNIDDIDEELEAQKARIEAELRRRKRGNAKLRKEEEDRMLIAAADGKVNFSYQITTTKFTYRA